MDDRVGEILAQRATLDSSAGVAIFFSVLLHAAITAIAAWSAWHHTVAATPEVMMIRFAQQQPTAEMTGVAPPPPAAKAVEQPKPVAKPKPIDKKKFAPPSPFGRSTKKAAEIPPPPVPAKPATAPAPAVTATAPDVPVGGSGVTALEGGDFPYPLYIQQMKRLIGSHWTRPAVNDQTTATVYFMINTDGTVHDVKLEMPSGNSSYDLAAQRAVLEAGALPPLPFGYSGRYLGVHLKFR